MSDFADHLKTLVEAESPSDDVAAVTRAQDSLRTLGTAVVGTSPRQHRTTSGAVSLEWRLGEDDDHRRVLLLGHVDTVWPLGTLARRPFAVEEGMATGPGIFDMKAGVIIGLHALAELDRHAPVSLLITPDEEIGSPSSRTLIETVAGPCQAGLVLEGAGEGGAVKSSRKGWSFYTLVFRGVAAHAGLEPDRGINVLPTVAEAVRRVGNVADSIPGATIIPTTAQAGTTTNTIPQYGELTVDVRCVTSDGQRLVHEALEGIVRDLDGHTGVELLGGINRPPLPEAATAELLARLALTEERCGHPAPAGVSVGGVSDANLLAAANTATLDGLGAVGGGAHAEHEWVDLAPTRERVRMITALVNDLLENPMSARLDDRRLDP